MTVYKSQMPRPTNTPAVPTTGKGPTPASSSGTGGGGSAQQLFLNLMQSNANALANSTTTSGPSTVLPPPPTAVPPPTGPPASIPSHPAAGKAPGGQNMSYYQLLGDSHWTENLHLDWSQDLFDQNSVPSSQGGHPMNMTDPHGNAEMTAAMLESYEQSRKKISDAHTYGPRFCTLYEAYRQKFNLQIDIKRHLMSLCTEHVVNFVKWARESDGQISWISSILLENDYLRPEVRNGVVMILIYTFASIKATVVDNMDMFCTLQDHEQGLGIANKFSLKIYNDPYNFLYFLKTSISALIDAGAIPDNERQNQPKRNKVQFQNREELQAFSTIQQMLIDHLDSGNNTAARAFVSHITSYWQLRGKVS